MPAVTGAPPETERPAQPSAIPAQRGRRVQPEVSVARFRRALTLLLLTVLIPGSAHLVLRRRRTARIALGVWAGLLLLGVLVALAGRGLVMAVAVRPWALTAVRVLAFGLAAAWAGLLVDAWRLGQPLSMAGRFRRMVLLVTVVLLVALVIPFLLVARYAGIQRGLLTSLFGSERVASAADGRVNVVLLGGDAGPDRVGIRTDSINLVSIDTQAGRAVVVGLPRNLEHAVFPKGSAMARQFPNGFGGAGPRSTWLLNGVYEYGLAHPALFPGAVDPGAEATKQAVSGVLGVDVHYFVLVDLAGFRSLVDALGGITLRVEERVPYGQQGKSLAPGLQHLDGREALWYARSRTGSSDYVRMGRQRCVLQAIARQANPAAVVSRFRDVAASARSMVRTDIPQRALPQLLEVAMTARNRPVRSLQIGPPLIAPARPDFALIRARTQSLLAKTRAGAPGAGADAGPSADVGPSAGTDVATTAATAGIDPAGAASAGSSPSATSEGGTGQSPTGVTTPTGTTGGTGTPTSGAGQQQAAGTVGSPDGDGCRFS